MTESIIFHLDRGNHLHILETNAIPHFDTFPPLLIHAAALINAGFKGVAIDEIRLANGRYCHALDVDMASPEGKVMQDLHDLHAAGGCLPSSQQVIKAVLDEYERRTKLSKEVSDD